ncbi:MAG: cyclic nucleotide-binding domain-containing protein [Alphaproteobacteria bacterium]|nr:cyclic nucleotide-binding domain-containing protein [Alphaproteobacteria bacterium]MBF0129785.1 cyclic nucleotide-binding domain-containing protein [Alphaproteobacteria bacterium]
MAKRLSFLFDLVDDAPGKSLPVVLYRTLVICTVLATTVAAVIESGYIDDEALRPVFAALDRAAVAVLTLDYGLRVAAFWGHGTSRPRPAEMARFLMQPFALFDLVAILPFFVFLIVPVPRDIQIIFMLSRFLKLARYSPALHSLATVLLRERHALQAALFITVMLLIGVSTALYLVEREAQPTQFGSIPKAMWWGIVTLVTLGYGDAVPSTVLGKIFGGIAALLGLMTFALPASILASGFGEEIRRRRFLVTWSLVAKVPLFARLDAARIAELAAKLHPKSAEPGELIIKAGDWADCMYFVINGELDGQNGQNHFTMRSGDYFGEIALIDDRPRVATIACRTSCELLVLTRNDFLQIIDSHPGLREEVTRVARQRQNETPPARAETSSPREGSPI